MSATKRLRELQAIYTGEHKKAQEELASIAKEREERDKILWDKQTDLKKNLSRKAEAVTRISAELAALRNAVPREALLAVEEFGAVVRALEHKLRGIALDLRAREHEMVEARKKGLRSEATEDLRQVILDLKKHQDETNDELAEAKANLKAREDLVQDELEANEEGAAKALAALKEAGIGPA